MIANTDNAYNTYTIEVEYDVEQKAAPLSSKPTVIK
jgi:hypothetical protein